MQRGGRRGDRAGLPREHGLIIVAVGLVGPALAGDIGRQRHLPGALEQQLDRLLAMKMEQDRAFVVAGDRAGLHPLPRTRSRRHRAPAWRCGRRPTSSARPSRLCSVAPTLASPRRPSSWAGMTRVSLNTSTSPGRRISGRSSTCDPTARRPRPAACAPHRAGARGEGRCGRAEGRNRKGRRALLRGAAPLAAAGSAAGCRRGRAASAGAGAGAAAGARCRLSRRRAVPPLPAAPPRPRRAGAASSARDAAGGRRGADAGAVAAAAGCRRGRRRSGNRPAAPASGPPIVARTIVVGCAGGSPTAICVDRRHALDHPAEARYICGQALNVGASMMKNWLLALFRLLGARHRSDAAQVRQVVEFRRQVGQRASRPRRCPWDRRPGP